MAFEWDATKNAANLVKHGIDFEDATPHPEPSFYIDGNLNNTDSSRSVL